MTEANCSRTDARWEELLEREAYGELSVAERSELDALAAESQERQHVLKVLAGIATHGGVDAAPSAADTRLIDTVLEQHGRAGRQRKVLVWLAAAAVVLPVSAAAAYLPWAKRAGEAAHLAPGEGVSPAQPSASAPPGPRGEGAERSRRLEATTASPAASAKSAAGSAAPLSAAELLAQAQKARSAGDYGGAIRAYQQLLRAYPASGEAQLAQLSLAQLHLAQGNAAAALAGFDAYQRSGGGLAQEAHYGKIQALRALGRAAEERAEIRRFLARYPNSLQSATLRRQLGASEEQPE